MRFLTDYLRNFLRTLFPIDFCYLHICNIKRLVKQREFAIDKGSLSKFPPASKKFLYKKASFTKTFWVCFSVDLLTPCYGDGQNAGTPNYPLHAAYENFDPTNPQVLWIPFFIIDSLYFREYICIYCISGMYATLKTVLVVNWWQVVIITLG